MNDCLVKTLNGGISGEDLPKLGYARLYFKASESYVEANHAFAVAVSSTGLFKISGGQFITDGGNVDELEISGTKTIKVTNVDSIILVPKYVVSTFYLANSADKNLLSLQLDDVAFMGGDGGTNFSLGPSAKGDIGQLKDVKVTGLTITSANVYGDMSDVSLEYCGNNITLNASDVYGNNLTLPSGIQGLDITGCGFEFDVDVLFGYLSMNILKFNRTLIYGDLEGAIEKLWNLGKRSGTITIQENALVTVNGKRNLTNYFGQATITFSNNGVSLVDGITQTNTATYENGSWTYTGIFQ